VEERRLGEEATVEQVNAAPLSPLEQSLRRLYNKGTTKTRRREACAEP
jgi:hypothetical protein